MPGEQGKWFYERARGQYQDAQSAEGGTLAKRRKFKERTPPSRKFTKLDLAKYMSSWYQLPHLVSQGGQMNFVLFMQRLRENHTKEWPPDEAFYRDVIAKAILYKAAAGVVRSEEFVAYRANIVTYLVAVLVFRSGGRVDLKRIWEHQTVSTSLESLMRSWSHRVAEAITNSAGGRNVTQWAKKIDCWKAVMVTDLPLPDPLPPEFHITVTERKGWGVKPNEIRVPLDKRRLKRFRLVVLPTLRNGSRYWIGGSARAPLIRGNAKLSLHLPPLLPAVGKRSRQGKMQGKAGES